MAKEKFPVSSLLELKKALKEGKFARLYIFFGEETFLLNYYRQMMKKQLIEELTEAFNYHCLNQENFSVQTLANAVESMPMMAEHTLVWIDDVDIFGLSEDEREKVSGILSDIPDYCTVLFSYETQTWKPDGRFKKLYQTLITNAYTVEFPKQELRDLIPWISRHFAAGGKHISPDLCSYLVDLTDGTMTTLAGEISKICAFSGADTIVKNDIDAVVEPMLDTVVFQMTDLLGQGQYAQALIKLQQLLKMQEKPVAILGAIGNHIRQLSAARTLQDHGEGYTRLRSLFPKISEYGAKKIMNTGRHFSASFYDAAAELIMETDCKLKTSYDEPGRLLEMLIMQLAQEAKNG